MRVMHFNSDIHTVTYLSKNMEFAGSTLSGPQRFVSSCRNVVNAGSEGGFYVELIGIKGLNWLSKHFINREWIAACERFIGGVGHRHYDNRKEGSPEINSWLVHSACRQKISNNLNTAAKQASYIYFLKTLEYVCDLL